jgi:hypothetical protein
MGLKGKRMMKTMKTMTMRVVRRRARVGMRWRSEVFLVSLLARKRVIYRRGWMGDVYSLLDSQNIGHHV